MCRQRKVDDKGETTAVTKMAQLGINSDYDPISDSSFDDLDMNAFMDIDDELELGGKKLVKLEPAELTIERKPTADKKPKPVPSADFDSKPSWLSLYDALAVADPDSLGPLTTSSSSTSSTVSALEPDGSLRFFWLDYLEHEGKLYFVGKLKDKVSGAWVSCCVTIEGTQRNLFVLPREKRVEPDEDRNMCETDVVLTPQNIHADSDMI